MDRHWAVQRPRGFQSSAPGISHLASVPTGPGLSLSSESVNHLYQNAITNSSAEQQQAIQLGGHCRRTSGARGNDQIDKRSSEKISEGKG